MKRKNIFWAWLVPLCLLLLTVTYANASVVGFDNPDLSAWYTDRYAPSTFETAVFDGDSRLHIGISASDVQQDSFYNYQGKKINSGVSAFGNAIVGDLFVDSSWSTGSYNVGMWGTVTDTSGYISAYPIIAYRNTDTVDAGFYGFDYVNGGWLLVSEVSDFGTWYNLDMRLNSTGLDYYINGSKTLTFADIWPHQTIENIILNSYNSGVNYDVYWDNVGTAPVPEPSTFLLLGAGLGGFAFYRRKVKKN